MTTTEQPGRGLGIGIIAAAGIQIGLFVAFVDIALMRHTAPPAIAGAAALAAAAWLAYAVGREEGGLAVLVPMLFLTSAAALGCAAPASSFVVALATGALAAWERGAAGRWGALIAAAGAGMVAPVGLVAWPALLLVAWKGGARWPWLAAVAMCGATQFAVNGRAAPRGVMLLGRAAHLGLPLSLVPELLWPASAVGLVLLALSLWCLAGIALNGRRGTSATRMAAGLLLTGLGAAINGPASVTVQDAALVAPLHAGLVLLALPALGRWGFTPQRRRIVMAGGLAFALLLVGLQAAIGLAVLDAGG